MRAYRVVCDSRVEARTREDAINKHLEFNGWESDKFFTDEAEAHREYEKISATLGKPYYVGCGLYWFDVVSIEYGDIEDDGEFYSYGADVECG